MATSNHSPNLTAEDQAFLESLRAALERARDIGHTKLVDLLRRSIRQLIDGAEVTPNE